MHRRNYGRRSGVLVDTCRDHGMWFDLGELDTILRWIKASDLKDAKQWEHRRQKRDQQVKEFLDDIDRRSERWRTTKRKV